MKRLTRVFAASMIVALAAVGAQLGVAGVASAAEPDTQATSVSIDNIWM